MRDYDSRPKSAVQPKDNWEVAANSCQSPPSWIRRVAQEKLLTPAKIREPSMSEAPMNFVTCQIICSFFQELVIFPRPLKGI